MKWCMWQLYNNLEVDETLPNQSLEYKAWRQMVLMLADTFAFLIKEQQKFILGLMDIL